MSFTFISFYQFFKVSKAKNKTIQNNTRQFKAIQGNSRQFKAIQGNSRQFKTIQDNSRQFKAIQGNSSQGNSRQFIKTIQEGVTILTCYNV
jgi:hypothetical protein